MSSNYPTVYTDGERTAVQATVANNDDRAICNGVKKPVEWQKLKEPSRLAKSRNQFCVIGDETRSAPGTEFYAGT